MVWCAAVFLICGFLRQICKAAATSNIQFKAGKARLVLTLKDSKDEYVKNAGVEVRTGRKWSASKAVEEAESRLRHKDIVGTVCVRKQGLGNYATTTWKGASVIESRKLVQDEIRKKEEESRYVKAAEMGSQGTWTKWDTEQRKLSWNNIWASTSWQLKFLLRSIYDVLPTPTNLFKWGLEQEPNCHLCQNPGNLEHILSSCQVALTQGRYTWRHNQVLKVLAHVLETERKRKHAGQQQVQKFIKFVKSGDKPDDRKGWS